MLIWEGCQPQKQLFTGAQPGLLASCLKDRVFNMTQLISLLKIKYFQHSAGTAEVIYASIFKIIVFTNLLVPLYRHVCLQSTNAYNWKL